MKENLYTPNSIRTFTGIYMNVFEPTIDMIRIEDIAHSLSMQCRFGGHLPEFYSVAQHSYLVSKILPKKHALAGLLHDASEAYLIDFASPIKHNINGYYELEDRLMKLIAEKFEFEYPLSKQVKEADKGLLHYEWLRIMLKKPIDDHFSSWGNKYAEERFIETFKLLTTNQ